jgi:hypothetical protein
MTTMRTKTKSRAAGGKPLVIYCYVKALRLKAQGFLTIHQWYDVG